MCVSIIAFVTRHANRIFSAPYYVICGLPRSTTYFHLISQTARLKKKFTKNKMGVLNFLQFLTETFLILRRIEREILSYVYICLRVKYPFFLSDFNQILIL